MQAPALAAAQSGNRPPNIVFLISDDHSWSDLGCYGNPAVTTPNLDRMAREGMRFTHGYVSSPQCSPNRSSHFTGCAPHTTNMSRLHAPLADWEPTIIDMLKERGYFTGIFRKHHMGAGFQKRLDYYGGAKQPFREFFDRRPAGKPFFLQVGFTDPHRPYQDGAFDPPHDPAKVRVPPFLPDHPDVRKDLAHYYDFIARMDQECGQLFELLKERGHGENTVVFFTGDNGMPFPRAKGGCYDPGIRTPLLVWRPGRIQAGAVNSDLIAHVDLPATWLELAGLKKTAKMQGQSFLPALLGQSYSRRPAIFSERNWHDNFDPIRCVRTASHKLIFNAIPTMPYRPATDLWNSPTWARMQRMSKEGGLRDEIRMLFSPSRPVMELYDLEKDPDEFHNRIDDPALKPVKDDLLGRLSAWMHETRDFLPPAYPAGGEPQGRIWPASL
jgi:arylsulfatase A-like enzyme